QCEYSVAAHPGQQAGPLARIVSGGELSRISLAIQMLASTQAGVPTLSKDSNSGEVHMRHRAYQVGDDLMYRGKVLATKAKAE
ncbi:MAG TPA: hypothetical protein PL002_16145, partial [Flavobacteriales bacterium]|nr:hypothetical protein [Flavobacteriales bacterium]